MLKDLDKFFHKSGLYNSKYIYIYSDFRIYISFYKSDPEAYIKKFLSLFTKKGITCIVPAFSYTVKGKFNITKTRSGVGLLGNFIMKKLKFQRSEHPLFSFIAIGKNKKIVKDIGISAFGKNSVHERLYKKNSSFLNFFRPLKQGNTLVHHIEQINKANYRYDKKFNTKVYQNNKLIKKDYKAYLRKDINKKEHFFTFSKVLKKIKKEKIFKKKKLRNSEIIIYKYDDFYNLLNKLYVDDNNIFIKKS